MATGLGRRVRATRTERGLSAAALAEKSGLTRQTIRYVEIGAAGMSVDTLRRVAKALDVPVSYLLDESIASKETSFWRQRAERAEAIVARVREAVARLRHGHRLTPPQARVTNDSHVGRRRP